jgi:Uncharacterized alpha/beta hydrolase domain (DUF2235)
MVLETRQTRCGEPTFGERFKLWTERKPINWLSMMTEVGSSSFIPAAVIGGIFGWGLKRNVLNLYKFVCRNYKSPADEIFAFGFSRGAFTIQVLIDLIASQGLVTFGSEDELNWKAETAYRTHRLLRSQSIIDLDTVFHDVRTSFGSKYVYSTTTNILADLVIIRFLGLWDTVAAYGVPFEGMTRALSLWFFGRSTCPIGPYRHKFIECVMRYRSTMSGKHSILFCWMNLVRLPRGLAQTEGAISRTNVLPKYGLLAPTPMLAADTLTIP